MWPNQLWIYPDTEPPGLCPWLTRALVVGPLHTEPPGLCPWLSTALVVGPFEEEEEGIGVTSDVVEVKCEDPATPGSLKGDRARWHVGDPLRGYVLLSTPLSKPQDHDDSPILL